MRKIFKFPIEPKETVQTIMLPKGAEVVSMKIQNTIQTIEFNPVELPIEASKTKQVVREKLFFWAIVDPTAPAVPRRFLCVGTGWDIDVNIEEYVDCVISRDGFVWHLLEVK